MQPRLDGALVVPADVDADLVMGFIGFRSPETDRANERTLHNDRQIAIQDCMRDRGFEYQIEPYNDPYAEISAGEFGAPGDLSWHEQFGFGISTLYWPASLLPPSVAGDPVDTVAAVADNVSAQLEIMSEGEASAFIAALWGGAADGSEGCETIAFSTIRDAEQETASREFDLLFEIATRVEESEEVVAYTLDVQECVRDGGYPEFVETRNYMDLVRSELDLLFESVPLDQPAPQDVVAALAAIQDRERAVAIRHFGCRLPIDEEIQFYRQAVEEVLSGQSSG